MIKLDKIDAQIIWYAKSWFQRTNLINDLKILMGKYYGCNPKDYHINDVYKVLIEALDATQCFNFKQFLKNDMWSYTFELTINKEWIIERLISQASIIPVNNLDLGEPDYTWLPKRESEVNG